MKRSRRGQRQFRRPNVILAGLVVLLVVVFGGYIVVRSSQAAIVGDMNNDGTVNILDFSILLSKWGTSDVTADLNHDGTVNIFDVSILLTHWGQTSTPTPSVSGSHSPNHWLMTSGLASSFLAQDPISAKWFFDTPNAFVMDSVGTAVSGLAATPLRNYKSYATFASDIANGAIPSNVHWVLYDNENWSFTPTIEGQHPAQYMKEFADLAHAHGLKVYEVPARDVVNVSGADCGPQAGETTDQAYIRCQIPADAQYADIYEIQAQADQSNVTAYADLVKAAGSQVKSHAPNIIFDSGLTTDRGDSVATIVACWQASHALVSGYWMNSGSTTLNVAEQAMGQIRASGG